MWVWAKGQIEAKLGHYRNITYDYCFRTYDMCTLQYGANRRTCFLSHCAQPGFQQKIKRCPTCSRCFWRVPWKWADAHARLPVIRRGVTRSFRPWPVRNKSCCQPWTSRESEIPNLSHVFSAQSLSMAKNSSWLYYRVFWG